MYIYIHINTLYIYIYICMILRALIRASTARPTSLRIRFSSSVRSKEAPQKHVWQNRVEQKRFHAHYIRGARTSDGSIHAWATSMPRGKHHTCLI